MVDFTKSEMRALRQLAETAWERRLGEALRPLRNAFAEWERGAITSFQLSDRIHEFHDGDARDLYKLYTQVHPSQTVAHAIANDYIDRSEVPGDLLAKLTPTFDIFGGDRERFKGTPGSA